MISRSMIVLLAAMLVSTGTAQEADLNAPSTQASATHKFQGVIGCRDCHRTASTERIEAGVTDFISLNESVVWVLDTHSQAFELIDPEKSALAKQICDKLGITDIHESRACLSCHSDWREGQEKPPTYTRGVSCESCHGPSFDWDREHRDPNATWRMKSVAYKKALGMIDVRHPIKRAEQCFGCHIGNAAEGKVITHAMYAAGHPPLPSIEIESFAQQMPRHWRYLGEKEVDAKRKQAKDDADAKPFKFFDEFRTENHKYFDPKNGGILEQVDRHKHRPAAVILGSAIALREYVELIRDLSRAEEDRIQNLARAKEETSQDIASTEEPVKQAWPELAALDCRACHHELEVPSPRQTQRVGSLSGRPTIPQWPATLVPLAIRHAWEDDALFERKLEVFHGKLAAVQFELERTPFGYPKHLETACSALLDWLDSQVIAPALTRPFESGAVSASFRLLIEIGSEQPHDFDSARQIAWAMRILSCGISNQAVRQAIDDALTVLAPPLRLELLNGPPHQCGPVKEPDETRQLTALATELPIALAAPIRFDAELFRQQMQKLHEALR